MLLCHFFLYMLLSSNYLGLCCSTNALSAKVPHNHRSRTFIVYKYITITYKRTPEMSHTASYSINFYWNKPSLTCFWRSYSLHYATMASYKITKQSTRQSCEASNISMTGSIYTALLNLTIHKAPSSYCCLKWPQNWTKTWLTEFLITANNR
jgi:hypothetical protein